MTWTRFDDAARSHPKAILAGNEAWGFWAAAVLYCNQFSTDGFISDAALPTVPPSPISKARAKRLADRLCSARISPDGYGLFERDETRGGYLVHDFLDWNPSKEQTEERRKRDRLRKESARTGRGIRTDDERSPRAVHESASRARPAGAAARAPSPAQPSPAQPSPPPNPPSESVSLQERSVDYVRDPQGARLRHQPPELWPEVCEVLGVWRDVWGQTIKPRGWSDPRIRVVVERFSEGSSPEDLCGAIRGSRKSDFLAARADLQELPTVLRDPGTVDKYRRLLTAPQGPRSANSPPQQTGVDVWARVGLGEES